jgi:light-regulated signal transduction histidine kinase (bacteriophytochrome)
LDFSRLGRKEITKTPINTAQMVQEVIEDISRHHSSADAIEWVIGTLPSVRADVSTIRQVWTNLLSNAVKYSKVSTKPRIEIGSYKENNQTVFYVKDNGVGFDEKYKEKLFRVFQRLHSENEFEGTGIGLALVEKIISRHDGKVWANGEVNKGASFYFSLP